MRFHVVTGLPRSGSTLLCNVLNQNPKFYASSTSPLPAFLNTLVHTWSNSVEVKGLLDKQPEETEERLKATAKGLIDNWYASFRNEDVIFDKSRAWSASSLLLKKVYPEAKIIVCVRNLVNVFASVEKQHRRNPLLDDATSPIEKTVYSRADGMFSPDGLIGAPIIGIEDLIRRAPDGVIYVQYESFSREPAMIMERLYTELEEEVYDHDFDNVKNVAEDPDGFYLHKYPHKGEGKISPCNLEEWKDYISVDLAMTIKNRFPDYNNFFGYVNNP